MTIRSSMYASTAIGVMDHDTACRVMISPTSNYVEVQCLKGLTLDDNIKRHYIALKDTPEWIQNRVNALSVLDPNEDHIVENVGVRSTHHTFWVYKND